MSQTSARTWTSPDGTTFPVEELDAKHYHPGREKPPGLGYLFVYAFIGGDETKPRWGYAGVRGCRVPCPGRFQGEPDPPPLPQLDPKHCGCSLAPGPNGWESRRCDGATRGRHTCGECGKPYWIEIHGYADGFCTYCYYSG